jgi:hypothetical protein
MQIVATGIDYSTGTPLVEPLDEQDFAAQVQESLRTNAEEVRNLTRITTAATTFRGEIERRRPVDLGDPRAAGWTFLVNSKDPRYADIVRTLRPLAQHRGMRDPDSPLTFNDEPTDQWFDWLEENYSSLNILSGQEVPHYVLIVGGPDRVPFRFQSFMDSAASVGRLDLDSLEDLETYIRKLIGLETAESPATAREAVCFAPDGGPNDATHFSRLYMAEPLAEHIRTRCGVNTNAIMGDDATKERLLESLSGARPALVYTASHGLGAPNEGLEIQKRFNGAICCQHGENRAIQDWLFAAEDVPVDGPFLEGAVFFQFACFGYGTPAESDFMHWLGNPELNAEADFVAALPKRLLAHPRGPVAFIGHVDTAWLHGFADPENPYILERWHPRIAPFVKSVEMLLQVEPAGRTLGDLNKVFDLQNALLTGTIDRLQRGRIQVTPEFRERLADAFIRRSDAQNYMVFGDPAAYLRIPDE